MRFALLVALALTLVGCREGAPLPLTPSGDLAPVTVSALDSLVGQEVSVNGRVVDHPPRSRTLVLDDGTGLVHVELPQAPPVLVGRRLFVQGRLREGEGHPVLDAEEWLYDSTAVSVRSD